MHETTNVKIRTLLLPPRYILVPLKKRGSILPRNAATNLPKINDVTSQLTVTQEVRQFFSLSDFYPIVPMRRKQG